MIPIFSVFHNFSLALIQSIFKHVKLPICIYRETVVVLVLSAAQHLTHRFVCTSLHRAVRVRWWVILLLMLKVLLWPGWEIVSHASRSMLLWRDIIYYHIETSQSAASICWWPCDIAAAGSASWCVSVCHWGLVTQSGVHVSCKNRVDIITLLFLL